VFFGPGVGRNIPGTFILYGSEPANDVEGRRLLVDQFYVFPSGQQADIGDICPVNGAERLPSDRIFPLTLLVLRSEEDKDVYGCKGGVIVSAIQFRFIGNDSPTLLPTTSPTTLPTSNTPACSECGEGCIFITGFVLVNADVDVNFNDPYADYLYSIQDGDVISLVSFFWWNYYWLYPQICISYTTFILFDSYLAGLPRLLQTLRCCA